MQIRADALGANPCPSVNKNKLQLALGEVSSYAHVETSSVQQIRLHIVANQGDFGVAKSVQARGAIPAQMEASMLDLAYRYIVSSLMLIELLVPNFSLAVLLASDDIWSLFLTQIESCCSFKCIRT